jgi:hypothetical protein
MTDPFLEALSIINSLEDELNKCRKIWNEIDKVNPHFDPNTEIIGKKTKPNAGCMERPIC